MNDRMTDSVTIEDADAMLTKRVNDDGRLYLGSDYAGEDVTLAVRVEKDDENDDAPENRAENAATAD